MSGRILIHVDGAITVVPNSGKLNLFANKGGALISTNSIHSPGVVKEISWDDMHKALITLAFSPPWEKDVETLVRTNNRVAAIKLVREKTGKGLKEAKDWVDERYPI